VKHDITDQLRIAEQLFQAQKMESVGRLAGGVAHDYNNMLGVILGFTELAMDKVNPSTEVYSDLNEILDATKKSAEITRQLLAFARKQTVEPKVLDLNHAVETMLKMLRRLIGEDIDLSWRPASQSWPVKIDPSQLEQVMVNLCVNARDAIETVGKITIETGKVTLDEAYCADHAGFFPGEFAVLGVSDDGCGMDKETLDNIFEPFFTTKDKDTGTGLGLAMVYGIVKQSGGFINVYSEHREGTTFKIYLPRYVGQPDKIKPEVATEIITGRGEMVLLVEDESATRKMCKKMLEKLGYKVFAAGTPDEAIRLAAEHSGEIHLLITDVIMPDMNGRDLANRLGALYPGIKTLFMSGYTANVIAHRGVLEEGVQFIPKPFSAKDLGMKIREILDDVTG
jgi:nitrogen-specific signal transduction histidine kinase/CheY-like chemotaxis protein